MKVYSGSYCMCDAGIETKDKYEDGSLAHTGDIVQLWHGNYIGTDLEEWLPAGGLTVVVCEQYTSFCDGTVEENEGPYYPFTMGIFDHGVQGGEWKISLVKKHDMLVDGERMIPYGFNFRK